MGDSLIDLSVAFVPFACIAVSAIPAPVLVSVLLVSPYTNDNANTFYGSQWILQDCSGRKKGCKPCIYWDLRPLLDCFGVWGGAMTSMKQ